MSAQLLKRLDSLEQLVKQQQQLKAPKQFRIGVYKSGTVKELLGVVDINGKPVQGTEHDTSITEDFLPLLDGKYRFVSLRGGRGSGKSVTVAKILLLLAYHRPLKVLCFREVQNSIKDSVYTSLIDLIEELGLGDFYSFTLNEIRGANGKVHVSESNKKAIAESLISKVKGIQQTGGLLGAILGTQIGGNAPKQ
ncbi:TPA: phage terminase large subunit [Burkholderia vietnamiensis]|uniref:phage terminase large subunit n=1 Tax=Burkholderia vietnamiensis TaxID=60552 RepID=UPI00158AD563|nr:phage terminase large subunit [Burkholderia vietnamiensis]HDR9161707.1 phage terminase large subunit [Burkholderia vietnamiensis]